MATQPLSPGLTRAALDYLCVQPATPDLELLDKLLTAYTRSVPWETAFRIAKRGSTDRTADCPRWPEEFWLDAVRRGGGGTCFESNYAFYSLLLALGFKGYLTINNMRERVGCHTAIVIRLGGERWLVDAGLPLYLPLSINANTPTQRVAPFHLYTLRPDGYNQYQVERSNHPQTNAFTLIDRAVSDDDYRAAVAADYGENGLFLDAVIINKVIDGRVWRYSGRENTRKLEAFANGGGYEEHIITGDIAAKLSAHFGMDAPTLNAALDTSSRTSRSA